VTEADLGRDLAQRPALLGKQVSALPPFVV
jgi:hypothetical protein